MKKLSTNKEESSSEKKAQSRNQCLTVLTKVKNGKTSATPVLL